MNLFSLIVKKLPWDLDFVAEYGWDDFDYEDDEDDEEDN